MSLADTLRWADAHPMGHWPETHGTLERSDEPDRRWRDLWEQSNPRPTADDFDVWYAELTKMTDRIWVAYCLPQFRVWDWSDEDVATVRRLVARHVCGVCGRPDDPGCVLGC